MYFLFKIFTCEILRSKYNYLKNLIRIVRVKTRNLNCDIKSICPIKDQQLFELRGTPIQRGTC